MKDERWTSRIREVAMARTPSGSSAHDVLHVRRVAELAERIAVAEHAEVDVVRAAALLHELVNLPKDHPDSHRSGDLCAKEAERVLAELGADEGFCRAVSDCIADHAFSKGARPRSLEAAILQDADRLDAIGAVGIARCFATCADMKRPFYAEHDPHCASREPNDKEFGLDHFHRKLLRIEAGLHTKTARELAGPRMAIMREYLQAFGDEIGATTIDPRRADHD